MQIDLSLNSESINKQVDFYDLEILVCESIKLSINELWLQNIITESAAIRGRNKLQKRIEKHLKKMNN